MSIKDYKLGIFGAIMSVEARWGHSNSMDSKKGKKGASSGKDRELRKLNSSVSSDVYDGRERDSRKVRWSLGLIKEFENNFLEF